MRKHILKLITLSCTSIALALGLTACHSHEWKEATCTEPKTCTSCDETEGEALGHDFGEWTETKAAACTEKGQEERKCSRCEETETQELKALGHSWVDATCTEPKTCSVCGETEGKALGHSFSEWEITKEASTEETGEKTRKCSVCGKEETETIDKIESCWEIGYYIDDFGDYTDDSYIIGKFDGTFSNSATMGSKLKVFVYLDGNFVTIRLLEYETSRATFTSSQEITMKVKDQSGSTTSFKLTNVGDLCTLDSTFVEKILNNEKLSVVITADSKYQSVEDNYKFVIENTGLSSLYKKE